MALLPLPENGEMLESNFIRRMYIPALNMFVPSSTTDAKKKKKKKTNYSM
jgi:hypothetical protein